MMVESFQKLHLNTLVKNPNVKLSKSVFNKLLYKYIINI